MVAFEYAKPEVVEVENFHAVSPEFSFDCGKTIPVGILPVSLKTLFGKIISEPSRDLSVSGSRHRGIVIG
jgi:hypothetical protein